MKLTRHCALILITTLFAAACGDDSDTEASASAQVEESQSETGGDVEAWCLSWNAGPISDSEGPELAMQAILTRAQQEALVAPPEIAEPVQLHLAATTRFVETMEKVGYDEEKFTEDDLAYMQATPEEDEALATLDVFSAENCRNATTTTPGPSSDDQSSGDTLEWSINVEGTGLVLFTGSEPEGPITISLDGVQVSGSAFNDWIDDTPGEVVYHRQVAREFEPDALCAELEGARDTAAEESDIASSEAERLMWAAYAQNAADILAESGCA